MAFTVDAMCNSFKQEILVAEHDFTAAGHAMKIALYDNTAAFDATTTAYTATNELPTAGNYTQTGFALTNVTPVLHTVSTAICDFSPDAVWSTATFTAYGAMIYNDTHAGKASVAILNFAGAKTATAGDFTVQFPAATAAAAIIRIA